MTRTATCLIACVALACGGGGSDGGGTTDPELATFTSLDVDPVGPTLYTVPPATTTTITTRPKDQRGASLTGGTATFASDNLAVATIDANGVVTARAVGVAGLTATLTIGGVTRTAQTSVSVLEAPLVGAIETVFQQFAPRIADVAAGGTLTWTSVQGGHNVTFGTPDSPSNIASLQPGVAVSRIFPTRGTYDYHCTIHAGMSGVVRVH